MLRFSLPAPLCGRYTRLCARAGPPHVLLIEGGPLKRAARRVVRVVEGARLEIVCAVLNRTQGSNP